MSGNKKSKMIDSRSTSEQSSEISLAYENRKPFSLKEFYDYDTFPKSTGAAVLPWTDFTRDFMSLDIKMTPTHQQICEDHLEHLIDLRPYMIENPEQVNRFDFLPKILSRFRHMHLRHMCVVNPNDGRLEGVITRQDIFLWMPL
jgi:CBS domain-containing protein